MKQAQGLCPPASKLGYGAEPHPSGFALLLVLWSLVLLSLLVTQLTASGRSEAQLALNLRTNAATEAAADGAVREAVFHLIDGSAAHWPANGQPHDIRVAGTRVTVRIDSEAGRINPNTAQPELMAALLHAAGADTQTARSVATAMVDWRFPGDQPRQGGAKLPQYRAAGRDYGPPGAPFESLDELGLVLGMTPELLGRMMPHLTLHHEGDPNPAAADPVVLAALREALGTLPATAQRIDETTVAITATALGENNSRFVRRAVVRIGAGRGNASLYEVLSWSAPPG